MSNARRAGPAILIASDNADDAAMVQRLLAGTFDNVSTSTVADQAVADFERCLPQVLVLAFNELQKAERHCLALYRLSSQIASHPHRMVILCDKQEVKEVAELCVKQSFDDYVLFWPMNHDAHRLLVSVHHALRALSKLDGARPTLAEFAAQARRLAQLEGLLEQQLALGGQCIDGAGQALVQAERGIGTALDGFTRRLSQGALQDVLEVKDSAGLALEMARLQREEIQPGLRAASQSVAPLQHWAEGMRQALAPQLESARALGALAARIRPTVLIVDDDEFQRMLLARMLQADPYQLVFAASGAEALQAIHQARPDLILMDVQMPGMDGIETTRRLKAVPRFADVAVIMLTGKSEGQVVVDSLNAGAADFVVKPIDRDKLVAKLARWSQPTAAPRG